jgi:hypothetical protein
MNKKYLLVLSITFFQICVYAHETIPLNSAFHKNKSDSIPSFMKGKYMDDYGIKYDINEQLWWQKENAKYNVVSWNQEQQFIVLKNDQNNKSEPNLYTRIDYMRFQNMAPFTWGYCYTVYNAATDSIAGNAVAADRLNPKKGCNGYPFSRMKPE